MTPLKMNEPSKLCPDGTAADAPLPQTPQANATSSDKAVSKKGNKLVPNYFFPAI